MNKNDQTQDNGEIKNAVLVYCPACKPDCEVIVEDFGLFEAHHCQHVNVLKRAYNPTWANVYGVKKK